MSIVALRKKVAVFVLLSLSFYLPLNAQDRNKEHHQQDSLTISDRNIYLVRHAEKVKSEGRDPALTSYGLKRAENIAEMLVNKDISHIYSTDYLRTIDTAKPLAQRLNLKAVLYDPSALASFAKELLTSKGNVLVVGHSNTTPVLVNLLGGRAGANGKSEKIAENEYDRLYKLSFKKGVVSTIILSSSSD